MDTDERTGLLPWAGVALPVGREAVGLDWRTRLALATDATGTVYERMETRA